MVGKSETSQRLNSPPALPTASDKHQSNFDILNPHHQKYEDCFLDVNLQKLFGFVHRTRKHTTPILIKPGYKMLRDRSTGGRRKVRVFYERKDPQHLPYFVAKVNIVAIYALFERLS